MLGHFQLRPLRNTHSISSWGGIGGNNNWTLGEPPRALQEVHQTQETHHLHVHCPTEAGWCSSFTDERVNGEERAQTAALLKSKEGAVSENHLPDASRQQFQTQNVLNSPLETPEPHVRGGTSMLHTIELVTETCHDARLYFLLMGLEASFVKGFAGLT